MRGGPADQPLPSFSIVMETANLKTEDVGHLLPCLDSMARQVPSPESAREVIILDSGDAPPALLETLRERYPWVTIEIIPPGTSYGDQKGVAVSFASGEVVFFADSDCLYQPDWLRSMLETFAERPDIQVLAGETAVLITGPYTLAMALVFFFPRFSGETEVAPAWGFYANNVGFRRSLFERYPFPTGLPITRGQNVVYSRLLDLAGIGIWRQPRAHSVHCPPDGIRHALKRFFTAGKDIPRVLQLAPRSPDTPFQGDCEPYHAPGGRLRKVAERLRLIARQQPWMLLWLPLAIPVALACSAAFFAGLFLERAKISTKDTSLKPSAQLVHGRSRAR